MTNAIRTLLFCVATLVCFPAESLTIYGHRGARGLAPENTLPAFQEALKHHVDVIDMDVVMTQEGVLVTYHDLTLNPDITRDARGHWIDDTVIIKHVTLEQLQTYNVGSIRPQTPYAATYPSQKPHDSISIPTLQEAIRYIKQTASYPVGFQIEIKSDPTQPNLSESPEKIVHALNHILQQEDISNRTKVQAYDWRCLFILQTLNPHITTAYLTDLEHENILRNENPLIAGQWTGGYLLKNYHNSIPDMIHALGGTWWDAEDIEITSEELQRAHQLGLKIAAWSWPEHTTGKDVNLSLIKQLIAMQVDGIITDRPDMVMTLLNSSDSNQHRAL
jgi:glycerophosphoryl diester phosphodiesterase